MSTDSIHTPSDLDPAPFMFNRLPDDDELPLPEDEDAFQKGPMTRSSRYLDTNAVWELIRTHPSYDTGELDMDYLTMKLRKLARCDNLTGPVFDAGEIRRAVRQASTAEHEVQKIPPAVAQTH